MYMSRQVRLAEVRNPTPDDRERLSGAPLSWGCVFAFVRTFPYALAGLSLSFPLVVVDAVAIWQIGASWRLLPLLVLTAVASLLIWYIANWTLDFKQVSGISGFLTNYRHCRFTSVPPEEYYSVLSPGFGGQEKLLASRTEETLSNISPIQANDVRIIVVQADPAEPGPLPSTLTAYQGVGGKVTIFLRDFPESLSGIQRFLFLHELGHGSPEGRMANITVTAGLKAVLVAVPFLLVTVEPERGSVAIVAVLAATALLLHRFHYLRFPKQGRLYDEAAADLFALRRCDPDWLRDYPPATAARWIVGEARSMNAEDWDHRRRLLADNLQRLTDGRDLEVPTSVEFAPRQTVFEFLVPVLLIACGILHGPPTNARLLLQTSILLFYLSVVMLLSALLLTWEKRLTSQLESMVTAPRQDSSSERTTR